MSLQSFDIFCIFHAQRLDCLPHYHTVLYIIHIYLLTTTYVYIYIYTHAGGKLFHKFWRETVYDMKGCRLDRLGWIGWFSRLHGIQCKPKKMCIAMWSPSKVMSSSHLSWRVIGPGVWNYGCPKAPKTDVWPYFFERRKGISEPTDQMLAMVLFIFLTPSGSFRVLNHPIWSHALW